MSAPAPDAQTPPAVQSALATIEVERDGLEALRLALTGTLGATFDRAVAQLAAAKGRVIVTGMGKSGHVARKIAATLASTGTPSHFVHPAEASHGDLGMIQKDDAILALSWSGEAKELADIVRYSRRFNVLLIAMTANAESALGCEADIRLVLPKATEACPNGLAPTTSTTMQLALGDAIAVALLKARGFSAQDFRIFHPGGKLGAQLKTVGTIMHVGEAVPTALVGTRMREAIAIMTAKSFGCVVVVDGVGKLAGIITDGDLRRNMSATLGDRLVEEIMTRAPTTVAPGDLLAEALEIVDSRKHQALVVVEGGRPVGLVHVLDLLRAGAA
ncbi:MAG: KpsF/GutQ family protein [Rhizobiales bacterium 65-9]|nr:KpsF/GutQ family sugar-phosphate isomerase [Hyphomicrobiales bacterium]OJY38553.1 MAG: KpsF/GutQ family protein [Rhizobiales bacterium 65-9]